MRRIVRYHALCLLGDMKNHPYDTIVVLGSLHFANPANRAEIFPGKRLANNTYYSTEIEKVLTQLIENGLIERVETDRVRKLKTFDSYQISSRDYDLKLSEKGRECLGMEQIARSGDYLYYRGFDGTLNSAKKINPDLFN